MLSDPKTQERDSVESETRKEEKPIRGCVIKVSALHNRTLIWWKPSEYYTK